MLRDDSPLRRLPAGLEHRQLFFFTGIAFSIEMADLAYRQLHRVLGKISSDQIENSGGTGHHDMAEALYAAWSLVDSLNRLRVLVTHFPGMSKRSPTAQVLLRLLATAEHLRNPIQHLSEECNRAVQEQRSLAVWGTLGWAALADDRSRMWTFVMVPGALPGSLEATIPNPAQFWSPIEAVQLTAYGATVEMSRTMRALATFVTELEDSLGEQFDGHPVSAAGLTFMGEAVFVPDEPATDGQE
jgi:hypothetical protein